MAAAAVIAEAGATIRDEAWLKRAHAFMAALHDDKHGIALGPPQVAYASEAGVHLQWPSLTIHIFVEAEDDGCGDKFYCLQPFQPSRPSTSFRTASDVLEAAVNTIHV